MIIAQFILTGLLSALLAQEVPIGSIHRLLKADLGSSSPIHRLRITFKENMTYAATYGSEGVYWHNSGSVTIANGQIHLHPTECAAYPGRDPIPCNQTLDKAICVLRNLANDLEYLQALECTSQTNLFVLVHDGEANPMATFFNRSLPVSAGLPRSYNQINLVTVGRPGITNDAVRIRKLPDVNSQAYDYLPELFGSEQAKPYVPAGTKVHVLARTRDKVTVSKWNNYWYLVNVGSASYVWMYAEFVRLQ